MSRTQLMKVRVRAPAPEYPDDGFEVLEIGYADGHTEEPRKCTCGMETEDLKRMEKGLEFNATFIPGEHASDCELMKSKITNLEWLQEDLSCCGDVAEYLWGRGFGSRDNPPSKEREFTVFGHAWAAQDYWGEWDGGFVFERCEP